MALHPSTPLTVSLAYQQHTVKATLPLHVINQDGNYTIAPGELALSVPDHLDYSVMKLHDPVVRSAIAEAVSAQLMQIDPAHPQTARQVAVPGLEEPLSVDFPDVKADWRDPHNYRYTHYELVGPSMLEGNMPHMRFDNAIDAAAVCEVMQDMSVLEARAKPFSELLQNDIHTGPISPLLFEAIAEQTRQRYGIKSDNMDDIWPFMKERLEASPEHYGLARIFPAITALQHSTIKEAATVMLANSQVTSLDEMVKTGVVVKDMQQNATVSQTGPLEKPFQYLPHVPASDTLNLEFSAATQTGKGWVEGVAVLRQDGSLVGMVSPDEEHADLIMAPSTECRWNAGELIVTGPEQVANIMSLAAPTPTDDEAPSLKR